MEMISLNNGAKTTQKNPFLFLISSSAARYSLRNSNNIMTIQGRTNSYLSSFLPSTARDGITFLLRLLSLTQLLHSIMILIEIEPMSKKTLTVVLDMYKSFKHVSEPNALHLIIICLRIIFRYPTLSLWHC